MASPFQSGLRVSPALGLGQFSYASQPPAMALSRDLGAMRADRAWFSCRPGPWGEIGYDFIYLEASDHIVDRFGLPAPTARWTFPGWERETVCEFLLRCGVPGEWVEAWSGPSRMFREGDRIHVLPVNEQIEHLAPETRAEIYKELAEHCENEHHSDPVHILGGSVEGFLRNSGIRRELAERFERMCYRRGAALCFSDIKALMSHAVDESEARRLVKLTTRTRAIIAFLNVTPATDIPALVDYWTVGRRQKDILPLFQSLAEIPSNLDLIHVLPALARKCLNSYPPPEMGIHGRMPDCHWTAMNFFNHEPQEFFRDVRLTVSHIQQNYDDSEPPYSYGDVLMFVSDDGLRCHHSCVFIADDIVFSKNGESSASPWILCLLTDLKAMYRVGEGYHIRSVRRKERA